MRRAAGRKGVQVAHVGNDARVGFAFALGGEGEAKTKEAKNAWRDDLVDNILLPMTLLFPWMAPVGLQRAHSCTTRMRTASSSLQSPRSTPSVNAANRKSTPWGRQGVEVTEAHGSVHRTGQYPLLSGPQRGGAGSITQSCRGHRAASPILRRRRPHVAQETFHRGKVGAEMVRPKGEARFAIQRLGTTRSTLRGSRGLPSSSSRSLQVWQSV